MDTNPPDRPRRRTGGHYNVKPNQRWTIFSIVSLQSTVCCLRQGAKPKLDLENLGATQMQTIRMAHSTKQSLDVKRTQPPGVGTTAQLAPCADAPWRCYTRKIWSMLSTWLQRTRLHPSMWRHTDTVQEWWMSMTTTSEIPRKASR